MPRARNVKPSLFKNELLGEADPILTILFVGLWTLADREGRLEDRPKRIKAEIFPYRELPDFNGYLTELAQLGFVDRYEVDGEGIIQVLNFVKHQSPHKTEKPSELPEKPTKTDGCEITVKAPLKNGSATVKESLIPDSSNTDSSNINLAKKTKSKTQDFDFSSWPSMPDPQILSDWFAMRKRIKADVSQTVINNFGAELTRAKADGYSVDYCLSEAITRNWRGLKTEWLRNADNKPANGKRESKSERSDRAAREYLASLADDDGGGLAWLEGGGTGSH